MSLTLRRLRMSSTCPSGTAIQCKSPLLLLNPDGAHFYRDVVTFRNLISLTNGNKATTESVFGHVKIKDQRYGHNIKRRAYLELHKPPVDLKRKSWIHTLSTLLKSGSRLKAARKGSAMGKSTTPTKWFKAVKKAFRSPTKERPSPKDKGDADERLLTKPDFGAPTPLPLPSFEGVTHHESQQYSHGALATAADPAMADTEKPKEVEELEQRQQNSQNGNGYRVGNHHQEDGAWSDKDEAAARIQKRFRCSPTALKGLIRLQALVRGQLVRRQAAITLRTMEAIVRVQALFRGRRVRRSKDGRTVTTRISRIQRLTSRDKNEARREEFHVMGPEVSEAEHEVNKRKRRTAYLLTQQLKRSTPNRSSSFIDCDPDQPHEGWAWLELWTHAKAWESRQLEAVKLDSKDYIEIIPGSSRRRTSDYPSVHEVDFRTLNKLKYHHENSFHSNSFEKAFEQRRGGVSPKKLTSPYHLTTPSPAASEDAAMARMELMPGSPNPSEASVKRDAADGELSVAMEHLILPEAANGSSTPSDSFSASTGVDAGPGPENSAPDEAPDCAIGNGGLQGPDLHENGYGDGTKSRQDVESPEAMINKGNTCRYMAATASAKAKFRSSSNPKTRGSTPEAPEAPAPGISKTRSSIAAPANLGKKAAHSSGKTPVAFGTGKTTNRRNPSPKMVGSKEKPHIMDANHDGILLARRNSLGSGDDKRWKT